MLDTHSLIWWLTRDRNLSTAARQVIEAAQRRETTLVLSSITVAELYFWNRKNRLIDFPQTIADLRSRAYLEWVDFTVTDAIELDQEAHIPEMHDRIIAGLARRLRVPLVTRDPLITSAGDLRVLW